jgi:hypothetical protein
MAKNSESPYCNIRKKLQAITPVWRSYAKTDVEVDYFASNTKLRSMMIIKLSLICLIIRQVQDDSQLIYSLSI